MQRRGDRGREAEVARETCASFQPEAVPGLGPQAGLSIVADVKRLAVEKPLVTVAGAISELKARENTTSLPKMVRTAPRRRRRR